MPTTFRTKDRFNVYVLLSTGCIVDSYEGDENGIVHFKFRSKEKCEKILAQLLSKQLTVYAHDFIDAIRTAQTIFYHRQ